MINKIFIPGKENRMCIICLLLMFCTILAPAVTFFLQTSTVYTHIFYIPLVLTAIWYGRRALYAALFLAAVHVATTIAASIGSGPAEYIRCFVMVAITYSFGAISEVLAGKNSKLMEAEIRYRIMVENSHDAIFIYSGHEILFANGAACEYSGYCAEELQGIYLPDVFCRRDRLMISERIERRAAGEDVPSRYEASLMTKDGRELRCEFAVRSITFQKQPAVLAMARDITERKENERKIDMLLRHEKAVAAYSSILANCTTFMDGINNVLDELLCAAEADRMFLFRNFYNDDLELCMSLVSDRAVPGLSSRIGDPAFSEIPYRKVAPTGRLLRCLKGKYFFSGSCSDLPEESRIFLSGHDVRNLVILPVFYEKELWGFIGLASCFNERAFTVEDIRLLKSASDSIGAFIYRIDAVNELQKSEKKYSRLVNNSPYAIAEVDGFYNILFANSVMAESFGLSESEMTGLNFRNLLSDELFQNRMNTVRSVLKNNAIEEIEDKREGRIFDTVYVPIIFGDHRTVQIIAHEITEKKKMEQKLIDATVQAQDANRIKSEFLATISHEIRTPLNGMIGFSELLSTTELSSLQREYLDNLMSSSNSLMGLINNVLDFSKMDKEKIVIENLAVNLRSLAEQSADMVKVSAHNKGLELLVNIDRKLDFPLMGDPLRLMQIFSNLLANAVKFTEQGEVEIEIKLCSMNLQSNTAEVRFSVRDTGIGIEPDKQNSIFEFFTQADSSTTRKYGGSGLGLTIARSLCAAMGGDLQVWSEPGKGSIFFFKLMMKAAERGRKPDSLVSGFRKALIVDTNSGSRKVLKDMLVSAGIESSEAADCFKTAEILRNDSSVDFIIADPDVPEIDGILKENEKPLVFMCRSSSCFDSESAGAGGSGYRIGKPVKKQELMRCISLLNNPDSAENNEACIEGESLTGSGQGIKILIAEDNQVNMALVKSLLARIIPDAAVFQAADGREACNLYREIRPHLVLMDVQMPVMDGYGAVRIIREYETARKVPVIALTAGTLTEDRERCLQAGMDDYLPKPLNRKHLHDTLKKYIPLGSEIIIEN